MMVTLNEVCRDDVRVLKQAMSATFPALGSASAFRSAKDRPTGIRFAVRTGSSSATASWSWSLPAVWAFAATAASTRSKTPRTRRNASGCASMGHPVLGLTTHTASANTTIALSQCRYLLNSVVPRISRRDGGDPILLADISLAARGSPSAQSCLPSRYQRADDNALQDVVVSPGLGLRSH